MKYGLLLLSMSMSIMGQLLFKKGVGQTSLTLNFVSIIQTVFLNPSVFFGFVVYGLSAVVWLFVLQKFPLSVAYPSLAMTYLLVVLLSFFLFKEPLTVEKIIGVLLIGAGVFLVNK